MRKHKMPSDRALKAIALYTTNEGMSKREAALQAGFSPTTAWNASKNIFDKPLVRTWLDNYKYVIEKAGLTQDRLANKLNELIDAQTDKGDPDYNIQLQTIKVYHEIFGLNKVSAPEGLKRRLTLDEFETKESIEAV